MKNRFSLNKLRNRIWLYFVIFTVLLVCLIWLLQTVFFEHNYQRVRGETMNVYADLIASDIKSGASVNEDYFTTLRESNVDGVIIKIINGSLHLLYPDDYFIDKNSPLNDLVESVVTNMTINDYNSTSGEKIYISTTPIFYTARRIAMYSGDEFVLLFSTMNSVKDTVIVLRNQLFFIAIIVTIISLFISYVIAERISRPIGDMSSIADRWAKGDETVLFEGGSYFEMEELANALNKAKTEVNKTGKLQRDLLANVTHDLKTPLTMIKAYAEMIKDISGDNKEKREKHTQIIIDESDRLTLLVNDILNLSKLQSQAESFEMASFNLSELVKTVIYRFDTAMKENGYNIIDNIEDDVFVKGDEKKIEEVIYNLIGNAINYTGDDKMVKVFLTLENKHAKLEILDSGKGIDKDKIETIWEKYYRYSETHKRAVKGTGLGLSIVKAILDGHNLEYGVISKVGVGSNFYVVFDRLSDNEKEE